MPFDQFTIEQLAGDMLPNATVDQRIATGFHRNTMLNEEGGIDPLEFRFYAMTDRTATTGTVWLGLTIGCAQCHTHKYDPISHHEYYGLFALLNNADEPELPLPDKSVEAQRSEIEGRIERLTSTLAERFPVPEDAIGTTPTVPIAVRRKELIGASFDSWVKDQSSKVNHWQIAQPASATATTPALTILDDESILASGDFRKSDTYDVQFSELPAGVTGFRLEVIPDERLPRGGPGAVYYEGPLGDFFLSEVSFSQGGQRHQVIEATQSFANGDNTAAKCIDGNKQSGWSIDGGQRRRHVAVFRLAEPTAEASPLSISMLCERWYAPGIGRFRWSYTSEPVGQANDLPSDVAEALMTPRESWSPEQRSALMNAFLQHAPELKQA
ncbi:MAG: DUF1549 domain-containing protein, partial [Pirellulaceae bacterium]